MEARIARLESDVSHILSDMGDVKLDLRALRDKLDGASTQLNDKLDGGLTRLNGKIDTAVAQLNGRIDSSAAQLNDKIDVKIDGMAAQLNDLAGSLATAKVWAVMLYMALAGVMLGTMARGFGWI